MLDFAGELKPVPKKISTMFWIIKNRLSENDCGLKNGGVGQTFEIRIKIIITKQQEQLISELIVN